MDAAPLPRGLAPVLRAALADTPVVCLLGPRQCGKTTLARSLAPNYGYVTFDDEDALTLARSDPNGFLAALPDPVILDEIQRAPDLLRALKLSVDRDRRPGRFLLTGSANLLLLPRMGESLAGRMAIIELQPLTASERERSPGSFLSTWLAGRIKPALAASPEPTAALTLAARVIAGGFPEPLTRSPARARARHRDYVRALLERDVNDVARFGHLLETFVLQQLTAQAGWTDPDLSFWHYRDKDQVEVDIVITRGRRTWGVEVKATATPTLADISGLRRLAAQCGDDFGGGLLLHAGTHLIPLGDPRFLAMPLTKLWEV